MKRLLLCIYLGLLLLATGGVKAQSGVFNPADPDVVFTSTNQPAQPAWNSIAKWGHTNRLNWNPYSYGYRCYWFNGVPFRVKFPASYQHGVSDGKKYPMLIFLHGLGERGTVYDNEYQLRHGGQQHAQRVNDGSFDGFLLYPQNTDGFFSNGAFDIIARFADSMAKYIKLDINRIVVSGLSSGGQGSWGFLAYNPKLFAAAMPISAASLGYISPMNSHITVPIWIANGGLDPAPAPYTVTEVITAYKDRGGNIRQFFYPNGGHGIWGNFWNEPDYFPGLSSFHKANPHVFFGRTEFCPGDPVSVRMGLQAGFAAYEWRKDGVTIPGATGNEYTTTTFGTYQARFKRTATSDWTEWSPKPVVVQIKAATITPPITISGLRSKVLPAPDGSTTVPLSVPDNYVSYEWRRVSDNALVGNTPEINVGPGSYRVKVNEEFGCTSSFSPDFVVLNASGPNTPDGATNASALPLSNTALQLNWSDNPSPVNNETGFEIYRSTTSGGPYSLITITAADVLTYTDQNLPPATKYYYLVRSINNNGAGPNSPEFSGTTLSDNQLPTAPGNLYVSNTSRSSVSLRWTASTDDVGIAKYDVFINGNKAYSTSSTEFTVNGLVTGNTYAFTVKARDIAGNLSPASNQVSAVVRLNGLYYRYYEGNWTTLPDFNTLTMVKNGLSATPDLAVRNREDNFALIWEGSIRITQAGTYFFRTNSDDGSKLYLGTLNGTVSPYSHTATALVNNDGAHGPQDRTSSGVSLQVGTYPIAITYFEATGGNSITVSWRTPSSGTSYSAIPASQFTDGGASGTAPTNPSNFTAVTGGFDRINLNWTDNSSNENGFEIWRSTDPNSGFVTVGTAPANTTSFVDSVALSPSTKYYYQLRAVSIGGQSGFVPVNSAQANWKLNNDYNDASPNGRTLTANSSPTFSSADKQEGSHSVDLNGSSQDLTINTAAGDYIRGGFSAKTVSLWMKSDVSNSNRGVFDLGGSDDGLAIRLNANQIVAGVASNNVRASISAAYNSTGWNHVALVYSTNTLILYVNGTQVASNTSLSFSSIGTTTDGSMIGDDNGTTALNTTFGNFDGKIDNFAIYGSALDATQIQQLMNNEFDLVFATTSPLPPVPGAPTSLSATGISANSIELSWNDNSSNETEFEVWRSVGNNTNFRLLATRGSNAGATATYVDEGLFSNVLYYYEVRAKGAGGLSGYSNEASSRTLNTLPVLNAVNNFTIRYEMPFVLNVTATDGDGESMTLDAGSLPSFAVFAPTGNGTGTITFNAALSDLGSYPIRVIVTDVQGGKDTADFTVTVNSNYVPTINAVTNVTLDEGSVQVRNLTANDQDGNGSLVWDGTGLPSFVQLTDLGNGQATLTVSPGYAAAGVYNVNLKVDDGSGGSGTRPLVITVNNKEPGGGIYYVNMLNPGYQAAPSPWNNVSSTAAVTLANQAGQTGTVQFSILSAPWNSWYEGATTGNNSGIVPDAVIRDYFYFGIFGAPETVQFRLAGLPSGYKYNLRIMGSSRWTGTANNGSTVYTIGAQSVTLNVQNNSQNMAVFTGLNPDANGYITVTMSKAPGTPVGYLNGLILEQVFDDGTAPVLPTNLSAQNQPDGTVKLQWNDVAYNELRYEVYRSTSENGTYTLLNPGADNANTTSYVDGSVLSSTTYYYKIAAVNGYGSSGQTDPVSIATVNKAPVLPALANVFVKSSNVFNVNVNGSDDPGDVLNVSVTNLPAFASFTPSGNGTGTISIAPGSDDLGIFKDVKVTVTDNSGLSVDRLFDITVTDNGTRSWYVNFVGTKGTAEGAQPWNDVSGFPFNNLVVSNLRDDNNATTPTGLRLVQGWSEGWNGGMVTGNNSGVFSDNVLKSSIYDGNTTAKNIELTGLNPAKRYNVAILSSNNSGFSTQATWTSGAQSKVFNAAHNSTKLIQLNGLTPNASGVITVTGTKASTATYIFMNALVVEEYDASNTPIRPLRLFTQAEGLKVKLEWSDRSYNETGFEIWRSANGGAYSLLTTVAANVETYTDNGVTANTRYYYRIRAINGGIQSGYSNSSAAMVSEKITYINLNLTNPAAAPWNNTNKTPLAGEQVSNFNDNGGINTGVGLVITQDFGGAFDQGLTGGTTYPDAVMLTSWWVEGRGDETGILKLVNLNQAKHYRVGITGSSNWSGDFSGIYTINGTHRYLNTHKNQNKAIYFENVVPNENGEITISMTGESFANWAFWGAIILESYDDDGGNGEPVISNRTGNLSGNVTAEPADVNRRGTQQDEVVPELISGLKVYPNPFVNDLRVQFKLESSVEKLSVHLLDISGKVIYRKELGALGAGTQSLQIGNGGELSSLKTGVYILRITGSNGTTWFYKLMKR